MLYINVMTTKKIILIVDSVLGFAAGLFLFLLFGAPVAGVDAIINPADLHNAIGQDVVFLILAIILIATSVVSLVLELFLKDPKEVAEKAVAKSEAQTEKKVEAAVKATAEGVVAAVTKAPKAVSKGAKVTVKTVPAKKAPAKKK
jgi:hypothetical protein